MRRSLLLLPLLSSLMLIMSNAAAAAPPRVPKEHPRLLGSRAALAALAKANPTDFDRVLAVARDKSAEDYARGMSLALVAAINNDAAAGAEAQGIAMKLVNGPIRSGHVTFGTDLALCGIIYDLCHDAWPNADRAKFHEYFNKTVDANVASETHVFHNAWFAYKNWGIGIGALAAYHENPRAPEIFATLDHDYRTRAAPALELAGAGGGWAEGYYVHYWSYEWLFFCEVARRCGGLDYYAVAPSFYRNRALASAFEMYPGTSDENTRRPVPMGDGGGRVRGGDRDEALAARRILVSRYRDDPVHQSLHAYNETTPRCGAGINAYKDFLWRDTAIKKRPLDALPLSHYAPGPGFVYARSAWDDDATYFFFKAGDRFTAHQHLDNGHFLIYRKGELAGDGGHYDGFGTPHDVNYHLRTIAHSTLLVHDPAERWPPNIRGGKPTANDGGQHHAWPHHNGAVTDPQEWQKDRRLYDIADVTHFEEKGAYLYVGADLTRAYASSKVAKVVRQIVYLRPGTFVILDEVAAKNADHKKTWLLQAMKPPAASKSGEADHLIIANDGGGKLFLQTLLPANPKVHVAHGEELYRYDAGSFPPKKTTGAAPEARVEVSPSSPAKTDTFLHVLCATDSDVATVPAARVTTKGDTVQVEVGDERIVLQRGGGGVTVR